jgi:hypothetical protein
VNAERLHAIARAYSEDVNRSGVQSRLVELTSALQNLVSQPNSPELQSAVSQARQNLSLAISTSQIDNWPATWQQALEEMGLRAFTGESLQHMVDGAFVENDLTPQTANARLAEISNTLTDELSVVASLVAALDRLHIGAEDLAPGEAEVMISIPRGEVHSNLPDLGAEFRRLDNILAPFEEIETGSRPPFGVRAIASSDFSVYLATGTGVAAAIAAAVDWALSAYLKLQQIKENRQGLKDSGLPDDALAAIDEYAANHMRQEIATFVDEYMDRKFQESAPRHAELSVALTVSMERIAKRIDNGYNFDVRAEPDESQTDAEEPTAQDEAIATIREISPRLKWVNEGPRILELLGAQDPDEPPSPAEGTEV